MSRSWDDVPCQLGCWTSTEAPQQKERFGAVTHHPLLTWPIESLYSICIYKYNYIHMYIYIYICMYAVACVSAFQ